MDVASICSLPPIDKMMSPSASFPKTNTTSNSNLVESPKNKSVLPSISSLLHPITQPTEKTSKHHDNPTALLNQPYLQTKPNSVNKSSANNSPSLLNLHSLSLETEPPIRPQSAQLQPSPPPTTPSLSRSSSNIHLNDHVDHTRSPIIHPSLNVLSPEPRPSPPESVVSLSKSNPLLNPHEFNVFTSFTDSIFR